MDVSTIWWLLAGGAVALELLTGTFFLLMLALGLAAGAVAAHLGLAVTGQLVSAAVVGGGAVAVWQRWRKTHSPVAPAASNRDVSLDIGQTVTVDRWDADRSARVRYRGTDWRVEPETPETATAPGPYRIVSVEGSTLIVQPL